MFRNIIYPLIIVVLFISMTTTAKSQNNKNKYSISGKIIGAKTDVIYLKKFDILSNKLIAIDSSKIRNGKFAFNGEVSSSISSLALTLRGARGYATLFAGDGKLKVEIDASQLYMAKIKGGDNSTMLSEYFNNDMNLYNKSIKYLELHHKMRSEGKKDSATYYSKLYKDIDNQVKDNLINFKKSSRGKYAGLYYIRAKEINRMTYQEIVEELKHYGDEFKDNNDYILISQQATKLKNTLTGNEVDDITLPQRDGSELKLSSLRGKYVLIDFWASWCGPCRKEAKHLIDVYKNYSDCDFEIVGISIDSKKNNWIKALDEDKTPWLHVLDLKSHYKERFGIYAIPRLMLISPDGKIIDNNIRGEKLLNKLKEIFGK